MTWKKCKNAEKMNDDDGLHHTHPPSILWFKIICIFFNNHNSDKLSRIKGIKYAPDWNDYVSHQPNIFLKMKPQIICSLLSNPCRRASKRINDILIKGWISSKKRKRGVNQTIDIIWHPFHRFAYSFTGSNWWWWFVSC